MKFSPANCLLGPIDSADNKTLNIWLSLPVEKMKPKVIRARSVVNGQGFSAWYTLIL